MSEYTTKMSERVGTLVRDYEHGMWRAKASFDFENDNYTVEFGSKGGWGESEHNLYTLNEFNGLVNLLNHIKLDLETNGTPERPGVRRRDTKKETVEQ